MDSVELGAAAEVVLVNPAFRKVCEEVSQNLRASFLGDDESKAMAARSEARAIEALLTKLTRLKERGDHIRRERLAEKEEKEQAGL